MRETRLNTDDLIQPVFVLEGKNRTEPVASMPGVSRVTVDLLLKQAERLMKLGVPAVALFPGDPGLEKGQTRPKRLTTPGAGAARGARTQEKFPRNSASSPTSRSILIPRTVRTG